MYYHSQMLTLIENEYKPVTLYLSLVANVTEGLVSVGVNTVRVGGNTWPHHTMRNVNKNMQYCISQKWPTQRGSYSLYTVVQIILQQANTWTTHHIYIVRCMADSPLFCPLLQLENNTIWTYRYWYYWWYNVEKLPKVIDLVKITKMCLNKDPQVFLGKSWQTDCPVGIFMCKFSQIAKLYLLPETQGTFA